MSLTKQGLAPFKVRNNRSGCDGKEEVMTIYVHVAVLDARCLWFVLELS